MEQKFLFESMVEMKFDMIFFKRLTKHLKFTILELLYCISHINSTWLDYQFIGAWGGVWNRLGLLSLWDFLIKTDDSQWQVLSVPCGVGLSLVGLHHNDIVVSLLLKLLPQVHALGREEGHGRGGDFDLPATLLGRDWSIFEQWTRISVV